MHSGHDIWGWIDPLNLNSNYTNSPFVRCLIKYFSQGRVYTVTRSQGSVELQVSDKVAQVGLGQLRNCKDEVGDVVDEALRVGRFVKHHSIYGNNNIVGGDYFLGRNINDLLSHVDPFDGVDERNNDLKP